VTLVSAANDEDVEVPEGKSVMHVLDATGDTKIIWDRGSEEEVDNARATFERLAKQGYRAYQVNRRGEKGEMVREFDPNAEKLILAPATVGG
jgi:hypothetical protein